MESWRDLEEVEDGLSQKASSSEDRGKCLLGWRVSL